VRDINDYCVARGIPSLAQGMIELPPSELLRKLVGSVAMETTVHTYRNRFGELEYRNGIKKLLSEDYATNVTVDQILATQGVSGGVVATLAWVKDKGGSKVGLLQPFLYLSSFSNSKNIWKRYKYTLYSIF